MGRLTKKINENRRKYRVITNADLYPGDYVVEDLCIRLDEAIDKLGQHEDIEEELGIDLITLYKALTNGVWVKNEVGQTYHTNIYLYNLILSPSSAKKDFCFITSDNVLLSFDRMKQDWALTKEELENDK